jgi:hypothetical protein
LNAIDHLDSAHKSGGDWVRIASSVKAWIVVRWEDPRRLEPIRIPAHLIPINAPPSEYCTLEAMRTQAFPNQCMDFKGLLTALFLEALPPTWRGVGWRALPDISDRVGLNLFERW